MSSDSQTAETSNASAPAPETSQSENEPPAQNEAPEPASLPEKPEENPPADSSAPLNENPTLPALTAMTAIKQYPKMNLRLNEFGIYELDTTDQNGAQSLDSAVTSSEPSNQNSETVASENVTTAPKSDTATNVPVTPAESTTGSEVGNGTEKTNGSETRNEGVNVSTPAATSSTSTAPTATTSATTTSSNGNGERERWKQRFPSNAMGKADIICCKQCQGYGIAEEFVDENYCSEQCRKVAVGKPQKAGKLGNKRKSTSSNSSHQHVIDSSMIVESSIDSCDSAKESDSKANKASASWSWSKYLEKRRAQSAPDRLFTDPYPYGKNGFRVGMKLEGIDPDHQSLFCVLTVAEVQGYRLRLHFDGYSDSHDFWVNADSENIFPCGWCEKNGQKLRPPKNWEMPSAQTSPSQSHARTFSWPQYLKFTSSAAAPRHLFTAKRNEYPMPSAFRIKMKLEAVDRRHAAHSLCVATVANVIGNRFLVHFDGWDSIYDYWADPSCPYVHPVGWAQEHSTPLTPPCDFEETGEEFAWDAYLSRTGATAVPPRAFKPRSPVGFKTGMKLECVDPRNPQLIRVATIAAVKGYRVKIHFDGWSSDFDFWTDDDWPDLHPHGWCSKTGHPLQPPLMLNSASTVKDSACPTPGCTGVGHIEGARYASHATVDACPYSGQNLHRESPAFPDRLAGEEIDSVPATLSTEPQKEEAKEQKERGSKQKAASKAEPEPKEDADSPVPQKLEPEPKKSRLSSSSDSEAKKSKSSPNIDLPIKSEPEAESAKVSEAESRPESPVAEQNYDSAEAASPPPKKSRMSFFTGKTAASEKNKRKSVQHEDKPDDGNQNTTERRQSERIKIANESVETPAPVGPAKRPAELDLHSPINSSLTTPLCWSTHSALLSDFVGNSTSAQAARWTCEQVLEFLKKFGINNLLLERFKHEEIDGEALLGLSQSDLTDLLGVKLGPAIKIRNALLLMREKARAFTKAN